jgi:hypothetical protein
MCGPWSPESLISFLDLVEPTLAPYLAADPNSKLGDASGVANQFNKLRTWLTDRAAFIVSEIEGYQPCANYNLVLNEFMATNSGYLEDPDEADEYPDWIELYNPTAQSQDIGGVYLTDNAANPTKYQVPFATTIPANGYLVFYADRDPEQGSLHTSFDLAAGGEELYIYDANGVTVIDSITFGAQITNTSYGRYPNETGPWGFMGTPTPGAANAAHNPPPIITNVNRTPHAPTAQDSVVVSATVIDDSSVAGVTLEYTTGGATTSLAMNDAGTGPDISANDNVYTAQIPAKTNGTIVHYWISAIDDLGVERLDPVNTPIHRHAYYVGYTKPTLFINELMPDNDATIEDPDEPGAFDDWIEIYNGCASPISLTGKFLSDNPDNPRKFQIGSGVSVPAGGYTILWLDDDIEQGPDHANFKLSAAGESVALYDTDGFANMPIDTRSFGITGPEVSLGRCPDGGSVWHVLGTPTPGSTNGACDDTLVSISTVLRNQFSALDTNGDGITLAEARTAFPGLTQQDFNSLDTDNNNKLTLEELLEASVGQSGTATLTWINFTYSGTESGTAAEPFNTLLEGLNFIADGGTITISSGSSSETTTISQRLIPAKSGVGRIPAVEVMFSNPGLESLIRENNLKQIPSAMVAGKAKYMQTFNMCLVELINDGLITEQDALNASDNQEELRMNMQGIYVTTGGGGILKKG